MSADVATLGVTAIARKKCKACSHPMAEHHAQVQQVQVVMVPQVQAPPSTPPGWYQDPTDSRAMCWWDGQQWHPNSKHYPA